MFKSKKWATLATIRATDVDPTLHSGSDPKRSHIHAFGGKLIFLLYNAANAPVYVVYDPAEGWSGVQYPPAGIPYWDWWSGFYGNQVGYRLCGNEYLLGYGQPYGGYGQNVFFTFDQDLLLVDHTAQVTTPPGSSSLSTWPFTSLGVGPDGLYARYYLQFWEIDGWIKHWRLLRLGVGSLEEIVGDTLRSDWQAWLYFNDGTRFYGNPLGDLVMWDFHGCSPYEAVMIATRVPPATDHCAYVNPAYLATNLSTYYYDGAGGAILQMEDLTVPRAYWAYASDPFTEIAFPWASGWEYRRDRDGLAYALYQNDLDGTEGHGVYRSTNTQANVEPSYNAGLGLYVSSSASAGVSTQVRVLDPHQPSPRAVSTRLGSPKAIAWIGTWAVGKDLKLRNVLDPDSGEGATYGEQTSPMDVSSGKLITRRNVFGRPKGAVRSFEQDVLVEIRGYPTSSTDWWWPGEWEDSTHYRGFWWMCADDGDPSGPVIGLMPDPSWGIYSPVGGRVDMGIGRAHLDLIDGVRSHYVSRSDTLSGTSGPFWLGASSGGSSGRRLLGHPKKGKLVMSRWYVQIGSQPYAECRVGRVADGAWVEEKNLRDLPNPELGESSGGTGHRAWNPWWAAPIPSCRVLPEGGWLVGATLYFAPWGTSWAWDAGTRDATFRSTGKGYVAAIPGADGPVSFDHAPAYFTDLDEWTHNRSTYGPDALLVYDHEWNFIECLSDHTMYPANGKSFVVTNEWEPRIIYETYRQSAYSDYAEAWGQIYDAPGGQLQMPMYACYDLSDGRTVAPGAGRFHGFLDMGECAPHVNAAADFPWTALFNAYQLTFPKGYWSPTPGGLVGIGVGGRSVTPLTPGTPGSRQGTKGVSQRA